MPEFSGLRLVGGTGLALHIGHRRSVDIDLFGAIDADHYKISELINNMGEAMLIKQSDNIHIYSLNSIKLDIVRYPYPWLENDLSEDGLKIAGKKDIAAMKLAAITGRGTKKDFIDLYFLLKEYPLEKILQFYQEKYKDGSVFLVLKSLAYFDDAEDDEMPDMLIDVDWEHVKEHIKAAVETHVKGKTEK